MKDKKKNKLITTKKQELTSAEAVELVKKVEQLILSTFNEDKETIIKDFIDKQRKNTDKPDDFRKLVNIGSLDNLRSITESVDKVNKGRAAEFTRQLYQEYDCQTASEKALAQVATISFERILDLNRRIYLAWGYTTDGEVVKSEIYPSILKRTKILTLELDRANRQFLTAIQTLKQVKTPQQKINVKTNTAFVAQNQQFNAERKEDKQNEIIEPK